MQSVAKKLNNGMEMTLAVCLFVWLTIQKRFPVSVSRVHF